MRQGVGDEYGEGCIGVRGAEEEGARDGCGGRGIRQRGGDGEDMEDARMTTKPRGMGSTAARLLQIRVTACSQV
jgi:hypothetical protein